MAVWIPKIKYLIAIATTSRDSLHVQTIGMDIKGTKQKNTPNQRTRRKVLLLKINCSENNGD